jgi:hypothetical protein
MTNTVPVSHTTGLAVFALSDTEWRISDPSRHPDDARSLLGFVQRTNTMYEVTVIGRPRERHYSESFDGALQHLSGISRGKHLADSSM